MLSVYYYRSDSTIPRTCRQTHSHPLSVGFTCARRGWECEVNFRLSSAQKQLIVSSQVLCLRVARESQFPTQRPPAMSAGRSKPSELGTLAQVETRLRSSDDAPMARAPPCPYLCIVYYAALHNEDTKSLYINQQMRRTLPYSYNNIIPIIFIYPYLYSVLFRALYTNSLLFLRI